MKLTSKSILPYFLILIGLGLNVILTGQESTTSNLHKSTKKYITPVYMHNNKLLEADYVRKYIDLDTIKLLDHVGKVMISNNEISYKENTADALFKGRIPNDVLKNLFYQDGSWTYDNILDRARNDMTDADYQRFSVSAGGIRAGAGRKFYNAVLKSNFIIIYSVEDVHTQEEAYDRIDRANKQREKKERESKHIPEEKKYKYKPAERTHAGFRASMKAQLYRIVLKDEDIVNFENHIYGVDGDNTDEVKFIRLRNYKSKVIKVASRQKNVAKVQEKKYALRKKYNLDYYFKAMLNPKEFEGLSNQMINVSEDFQVATTIFETKKGIQAKIGKKEGLERNGRFYVYEYVQNESGKTEKMRIGAIRAKRPAKNEGLAIGNTKPTKFYQIQGRKLGKGMMLEENKNWGSFGAGYGPDGFYLHAAKYSSYVNAGLWGFDFQNNNQTRFDSVDIGMQTFSLFFKKEFHFIPNIALGADVGVFYEASSFQSDNYSEIFVEDEDDNNNLNYRLGASLNYYLTPKYKIFASYLYLPGSLEYSTFKPGAMFEIDRNDHRYFFGITLEF